MPENDFEKEVQQLFDGLKLKPTAEVWSKVQTRIRKAKRRRRFVLWLPLLLLMLGAGSYWFAVNNNNQQNEEISVVKNSKEKYSGEEKNTKEAFEIPDEENNNVELPLPKVENKKLSTKVEVNQNYRNDIIKDGRRSDLSPSAAPIAGSRQLTNNKALDLDIGNASITHPAPVVAHIQKYSGNAEVNKSNDNIAIQKEDEEKDLPISDSAAVSVNTYSTTGLLQSVVLRSSIPGDVEGVKYISSITQSSRPVIKLGKKKLWEIGIEAGAGVSKMGKGIADLLSLHSDADKSMAPNNMSLVNSGNTISNLTGRNNIYVMAIAPSASAVKPGMAWHLGIFTKWHFKDRLSLSTGLRYSYFSTHMQVGKIFYPNNFTNQNLPSSSPSYAASYPGDATNEYTNRYHYVTMPVGLQWQLNKGIKLPIELNAGADLSWLTATNALHYNSNTGSYFEEQGRFNTFQAGISAGVSVRLFQHNKHSLDIGPIFHYNITNLVKKGYDNNQNIIYGGISARLVLWKK